MWAKHPISLDQTQAAVEFIIPTSIEVGAELIHTQPANEFIIGLGGKLV